MLKKLQKYLGTRKLNRLTLSKLSTLYYHAKQRTELAKIGKITTLYVSRTLRDYYISLLVNNAMCITALELDNGLHAVEFIDIPMIVVIGLPDDLLVWKTDNHLVVDTI